MSLSREEAALLLAKYADPSAPSVMCVFMSPSANSARVFGQLSAKKVPELGLVLTLRSESEDMIFFTMDERCRFEYANALEGPEWLRETSKRNFEGVLAIINSSGDRLYIYEPK